MRESILIPSKTQAWLNLIPFKKETSVSFFRAIAEALDGDRIIQGLTLYPANAERDIHELAHIIQCPLHLVTDPYFGHPEFIFERGKDKLSTEAGLVEAEVFCIEGNLRDFLTDTMSTDGQWPQTLATTMRGLMDFGPFLTHGELTERAVLWTKHWTIDRCWLELQRKAKFIRMIQCKLQ